MIGRIGDFARFIFVHTRGRALLALIFLLLGGLTEGMSILLLIPLLQLAGQGGGGMTMADLPLVGSLFAPGVHLALLPLLACFLGFVTVQAVFTRFRTVQMAQMMQACVDDIRLRLFGAIGAARWRLIAKSRPSDIQQALSGDIERIRAATFNLLLLAQAILMMAVYATLAAVISWKMTLFALAVGGAVLVALYPVRRRAAHFGQVLTASLREQQQMVSDFLGGMKLAKAYNAEAGYVARLGAMLGDVRREMVHYARAAANGALVFQVAGAAAAVGFIYVAVAMLHLPLPRIAVLLFLFVRIGPRFTTIQDAIQQLLSNLPAFDSARAMTAGFEGDRESAEGLAFAALPPLRREIRFDRVSFRYPDGDDDILREASFVIPAGEITAITGPSGSGKSTMADMIMGLAEPRTGQVLIDGRRLDAASLRSWRERVAYVPQEVFLLNDSIAANLALAAPDASEAAMWDALEAGGAAGFVRLLPEGLATIVADRGIRLSGGERQRIALARALLRKPDLLLLDEATSALDPENERLIVKSLERLRGVMTIVTIAHRAQMTMLADQLITIEPGPDRDGVIAFRPPQRATSPAGRPASRGE
ncbi:ABC transporter ATP-binding protein [Sphingomonas sp. SRS2]|uniref:ABC transporter ATP-binding protein n=1 Tax=Sphingomonas sp. SRS2 TaxID=133190 RepID=UPI0006184299|nr:ABC transporter ATP-binding protein [Sphingomonas sp. SRS2]KKC27754.1 ABC transporter [Sphingomonas sp. SRS2]